MNLNQDFTCVEDYLESIKGAMLLNFYVKVKNKLMQSDDSAHPFDETLREFFDRKEVQNNYHNFKLSSNDHYSYLDALKDNLKSAIVNDRISAIDPIYVMVKKGHLDAVNTLYVDDHEISYQYLLPNKVYKVLLKEEITKKIEVMDYCGKTPKHIIKNESFKMKTFYTITTEDAGKIKFYDYDFEVITNTLH